MRVSIWGGSSWVLVGSRGGKGVHCRFVGDAPMLCLSARVLRRAADTRAADMEGGCDG